MVKIGIFGLGTVGGGLLEIIRKSGLPVEVKAVVDRSYQKKTEILNGIAASDDPGLILNDSDIDLVIELMGGVDHALYVVREALDRGKNVITANKYLLAEHGYALFTKAREVGLKIGFEAAVAGAIPIISNLENNFANEKIDLLEGVLNGTSNYILTRMRVDEIDYSEALSDAQKLGFAEADPTLDVNGMDAAHKLALLASIVSEEWIDYQDIYLRGIEKIRSVDICESAKMGYRIRLLARYLKEDEKVYLSVEPSLIKSSHHLWDIEYENNAIMFRGEYSNDHLFKGKGAGAFPTAYSVLSDIMHYTRGNYNPQLKEGFAWHYGHPTSLEERLSPFYLRLLVPDRPGVLASIAGILNAGSISIASVYQDAPVMAENGADVDLIIVTHKCRRADLHKALVQMEESSDSGVKDFLFLPIDEG